MASFWYHRYFYQALRRDTENIDLDGDATIKIMLLDTGYTPAKTNDFVSDTTPGTNEVVCTNYTTGYGGAGRKALATKAVVEDNTNMRAVFDAADVTWTSLGGATNDTVATAVVFKEITSDGASPLILQLDINPDVTTNGGDFTIQFADGNTLGVGYVGV
jgi:hypothetical protein